MFGSDYYGMEPDIITIAKGLTSAYAPLSGSIVSDKVWQTLEQGTDEFGPIGHGWTYSAHPICVAAGVANLQYIDDQNLIANNTTTGDYFRAQLNERLGAHKHVGEIRGVGMLAAIEFVQDQQQRQFFDSSAGIGPKIAGALAAKGVIGRAMPQGDILGFAPPFCMTQAEADIVVEATTSAVTEVLG